MPRWNADPSDREYGPLEAAARSDVARLGELTGMQASLAQSAYALARVLDYGTNGMGAAAVARELRETLTKILEMTPDDDDGTEAFLASLGVATPGVPTEVRDIEDARARDAGSEGRGGSSAAGPGTDAVAAARGGRRAGGQS